MYIVVFDVGNASCNYICSPNKYAMMIDCGSSAEKQNPVESIKNFSIGNSELLKSKPYVTSKGKSYPLALLHITHPDDDHFGGFVRLLEKKANSDSDALKIKKLSLGHITTI